MIKDILISDIELRATHWKPSDDLELERSFISHLLDVARDELVQDEITRSIRRGHQVNPVYLEKELSKSVTIEDDPSEETDRYFITLTKVPMILPKDRGIAKVQISGGTAILPTTIEYLDVMKELIYAAPNEDRPLYYRIDDKIFIEGFQDNTVRAEKFNVYYVASYSEGSIGETDDFKISDEQRSVLLDIVEDKLREQMGINEDLENDGIQ